MAVRHTRAAIEHVLEIFGKVTISGSAATLASASGELQQTADVSFTNTAAGDYTVIVNPFKMPRGEVYVGSVVPFSAAGTAFYAEVRSAAYTNDSLSVRVQIFNSADSLADPDGFFFHFVAQ